MVKSNALRRADLVARAAGQAHRDATGDSIRAQRIHPDRSARSHRRDYVEGPREVLLFLAFLDESEAPWRYEAHVRVRAKMRTLDDLTERQLIERVRDLRERQADLEAEGRKLDMRGASLGERAVNAERLSAVTAELSAALLLCEGKHRLTVAEVLGG